MTTHAPILILGAGPAGLATGYALQGHATLLEREATPGGLCRSITVDGGVFDLGGHSFHTPMPEVQALAEKLLGGRMTYQRRHARVSVANQLIDYPFQQSFRALSDPVVVAECEAGLAQARATAQPAQNFEEHLLHRYGEGIARHFLLPYNRKLWGSDLRRIGCEWIGQRVAGAHRGEPDNSLGPSAGVRRPLQPDSSVGYPADGGFEEIFKAFVPYAGRIVYSAEAAAIDPEKREVTTRDGARHTYASLVSSLPLPELLRRIAGVPPELLEAAASLAFVSLRVELILVDRPLATDIQRIYSADPAVPPHKIALNHNSSDTLRRAPAHAIMAEVSCLPERELDPAAIAPRTIEHLCELGILRSREHVAWTRHVDLHYGYPIMTHDRPAKVAAIRAWLEQRDIHIIGRFGEWEYVNSDACIAKGLALGRHLLHRHDFGR